MLDAYSPVYKGVVYVFPELSISNTVLSSMLWVAVTVMVKLIPSMDCTWEGKFNVQFNMVKLLLIGAPGPIVHFADQQGEE